MNTDLFGRITGWSIERRGLVLALLFLCLLGSGFVGKWLKFDALPDVTNNQVLILTTAPGLSPEEVERLVTRPIETVIGGLPGLVQQRSISRFGISSVTAIFDDSVPALLARQMTQERLSTINLPPQVETPMLGPLTGGLGEIYHFALSSPQRSPAELLELSTYKIAPRLRTVAGVVEVNNWGGEQRVLEARVDPLKLASRALTLSEVESRMAESMGSVAGASLPSGPAQALLRGIFRPTRPEHLAGMLLSHERIEPLFDHPVMGDPTVIHALRLSDVATLAEGSMPRIGAATRNGRGETVYVMVQMLRGENALDVLHGLHDRMAEIKQTLPKDVEVELIYDRSNLVHGTLRTVGKNLLEGGALVVLVLLLFLGSFRAGLLVALAIPISMLGAAVAMVVTGVPGNLMSLGALDFGLLVDGSVVMIENLFHKLSPTTGPDRALVETLGLRGAIQRVSERVARPVLFSVLIILLVYVPVLGLGGVEGKMFRPMALTVVFALLTSLILALTVMPAAASFLIRRSDLALTEPRLVKLCARFYRPMLQGAIDRPFIVAGFALALLGLGAILFVRSGSEFVPQLDEGDLVIQTTRSADISLPSAVRDATHLENTLLKSFPELTQVVSRIGSPAVATDIMGLEQADVFVALRPRKEWPPGRTKPALIHDLETVINARAPGGDPAFTQPIQMRFNEILAGAVTDVVIAIYGDDLKVLRRLAEAVALECAQVKGAVDVRVLAPPDVPLLEVRPRPLDAAQVGLTVREVLAIVQSLRSGLTVGITFDGPVRIPVVLRLSERLPSAQTLSTLPIAVPGGGVVPLSRVADVLSISTPSVIHHENAERRLLVGLNVRGADLGTLVATAQARVHAAVPLPSGYRIEWGGQFETLRDARARLFVLVPLTLLIIVCVLYLSFRSLRSAIILFLHVPFACTGGMLMLWLRGMPVSISAAIGFIALSGIAVLNGVVLLSHVLEQTAQGKSAAEAAKDAALSRMRPVLMTALVAAFGFVPMMLADGIGAEVQRPLATVVVGGLLTSTLLTLLILPSLYPFLSSVFVRRAANPDS